MRLGRWYQTGMNHSPVETAVWAACIRLYDIHRMYLECIYEVSLVDEISATRGGIDSLRARSRRDTAALTR